MQRQTAWWGGSVAPAGRCSSGAMRGNSCGDDVALRMAYQQPTQPKQHTHLWATAAKLALGYLPTVASLGNCWHAHK